MSMKRHPFLLKVLWWLSLPAVGLAQTPPSPDDHPCKPKGEPPNICAVWDSENCEWVGKVYKDACGVDHCEEQSNEFNSCCRSNLEDGSPDPDDEGILYDDKKHFCCNGVLMPLDGPCDDFSGVSVGPFSLVLEQPAKGTRSGSSCQYSFPAKAGLSLIFKAIDDRSFPVELKNADVAFSRSVCTKEVSDISLTWSGSYKVDLLGGKIEADVKKVSFNLPRENSPLEGRFEADFTVKEDVAFMGDRFVLLKDSTGTLEVSYSEGKPTGRFTKTSLKVEMRKKSVEGDDVVLATFKADGGQTEPSLIKGQFTAHKNQVKIGQVIFRLNLFDSKGKLSLEKFTLEIEDGNADMDIILPVEEEESNYMVGMIACRGKYKKNEGFSGLGQIGGIDGAGDFTFFNATLAGTLEGAVSEAIELQYVRGKNIALRHSATGSEQSITVTQFNYLPSGLDTMNVAEATILYTNKVYVHFDRASWISSPPALAFANAEVRFGDERVKLTANDFKLNGSGWNAKSLTGKADFTRLYVDFRGHLKENEFGANLTVKFMDVGASGTLAFGSPQELGFNYAAIALSAHLGSGVPLGVIPLRLTYLNGIAGYNQDYNLAANSWTPTLGQHVLGAGIGLADPSALVAVESQVVINLKEASPTLDLRGRLAIPAAGPKYMSGEVYAKYVLGERNITGSARSALNFPPGGNLVAVNTGATTFNVSQESIEVASRRIRGTLLGRYPFAGAYELSGVPSDLSTFGGRLAVNFNYSSEFEYSYPVGFDPAIGSGFGFSILGNCLMSGWSTLTLSNGDFSGETTVEMSGDAVGQIRFPSLLGFGGSTISSSGGLRCSGSVRKDAINPLLLFSGEITIYYNEFSGSTSVSDLPVY